MTQRDPDPLGSREQVAAVASRLGHGLTELATDIREAIESALPALRDDNGTGSLLEASVQQNIETVLGILRHGIDPAGVEPPSAAIEYARRLAQRGVSTFALIRAYRLGQTRLLQRLMEDLVRLTPGNDDRGRAALDMVARVSDYVDRVVEQLITSYAEARKEWLDPNAILGASVQSVLYEKSVDVEAAQARLGRYIVRQHHLGVELWLHGEAGGSNPLALLRYIADALASAAGCHDPPLFLPLDESGACVWLPLATRTEIDRGPLRTALVATPGAYAALGEPASSLTGFRRTHQQALSARAVAIVTNPPRERVTPYAEVAPIATMCADLDAARSWVAETLGPLAIDDERHARLRETARVFLATGGSYAAAAEQLALHRNTAQYRVQKAEEIRGRPLRESRLDVELALLACHWFGKAVLQSVTRPARLRRLRPN